MQMHLMQTTGITSPTVLSAALKAALEANSTTVKNSLEAYVKNNGGTAMPKRTRTATAT